MERDGNVTSSDWMARIAALFVLAAGVLHLLVIPQHWDHAPAHGIFLASAGVVQILWAIFFWFRASGRLATAGIFLSLSLISLWAITRILPAPFTGAPEAVDTAGVLIKVLEAAGALVLARLVLRLAGPGPSSERFWQTAAATVVLAVVLSVGIYEVARAAEPLFPGLVTSGAHSHGGAGHEEAEDHEHAEGDHEHEDDHEH